LASRLSGLTQREIGEYYGGVSSQAVSAARKRAKELVAPETFALNFNNGAQNRRDSCSVHDNYLTLSGAPEKIAAEAGLEPAYRNLLAPDASAPKSRIK